jgi:uroporphyrinogen decarboxylase
MTSKERVRRAIAFEKPDRVPMLFFNEGKEYSDIVLIDIQNHFMGGNRDVSEWGFTWERMDGTMGQPRELLIKDWSQLSMLTPPAVDAQRRVRKAKAEMSMYPKDRYFLASLQLTGFTIMTFLRGFAETLEALLLEPEKAEMLADIVFGFEEDLIRVAAAAGFDGIAFYDDWGTQSGMIVSPDIWKEFFKPRYTRQFALAHELDLQVYFHTCGNVLPIIPEFKEMGVDMLNLGQPNCYDIELLGRNQNGQCFVMPVSYQTISLTGTRGEIFRDVEQLVLNLGDKGGGLIGYVEEYSSMGMSSDNYQSCVDAFAKLGVYHR